MTPLAFAPGAREVGAFIRTAIGALALLAGPMTHVAAAQQRPGPAAEFAGGWVGLADDGIVSSARHEFRSAE